VNSKEEILMPIQKENITIEKIPEQQEVPPLVELQREEQLGNQSQIRIVPLEISE
jgi:hypothetical protein